MVDRGGRTGEALAPVIESEPAMPAACDPAQGLRVRRFGARLHLLVEIPSIRRAVVVLRADFTSARKWIVRALRRSTDQE